VAIFDNQGNLVSHSNTFPLNAPRAANQGLDAVGNPVAVDPNVTMGVRATQHHGTQRLVVGGSAEAFAAIENDSVQRFRAEDLRIPICSGHLFRSTGYPLHCPVVRESLEPGGLMMAL
jgi:hypothetical protein